MIITHKRISTDSSLSITYDVCHEHEPSLVTLAPTTLLWLSGRASGLVTRRSLGSTLVGSTRIYSSEGPV